MSAVEVTLVANGRKYRIGSDVVTVPASQIVLAVRGASGPVRLDGTTKHLDSTGGILPLDLRRSTGYHRLTVKGDDYWFATDDAKAKLSGVEEMLADLRGFGTGWTGQIAFSNGTGVRDPHVVYSWLDRRADNILTAAREILRSPRTEQVSRRALSQPFGVGDREVLHAGGVLPFAARVHKACSRGMTRSKRSDVEARQPTIRRECRSVMNAT